jgi:hypothetical protein
LGDECGVLGVQMSERVREKGGSGVFIWRGVLGDRREWSWRPGHLLAGRGGGVSVRGRGVRGEQRLEACVCPEVPKWSCRPFGHVCVRRCSTATKAA